MSARAASPASFDVRLRAAARAVGLATPHEGPHLPVLEIKEPI